MQLARHHYDKLSCLLKEENRMSTIELGKLVIKAFQAVAAMLT